MFDPETERKKFEQLPALEALRLAKQLGYEIKLNNALSPNGGYSILKLKTKKRDGALWLVRKEKPKLDDGREELVAEIERQNQILEGWERYVIEALEATKRRVAKTKAQQLKTNKNPRHDLQIIETKIYDEVIDNQPSDPISNDRIRQEMERIFKAARTGLEKFIAREGLNIEFPEFPAPYSDSERSPFR